MEGTLSPVGASRVLLNHRPFSGHPPVPARRPALRSAIAALKDGPSMQASLRSSQFERQLSALEPTGSSSDQAGLGGNILPRARPRRRLKVAVDVDEVLGQFLDSLNRFCLDEHGQEYEVSDYFLYDFAKVWKCSQEASNVMVHDFFQSQHFAAGIEPIPGALDSLRRLQPMADLVVVTSRQHVIQGPTLNWVETHFPQIFQAVHFGNHWAMEGTSQSKVDMCRSVAADVLIDDNPTYAEECAAAGLHVLLFDWEGRYPWARTPAGPTHDLIFRVSDWEGVERELHRLSLKLAS